MAVDRQKILNSPSVLDDLFKIEVLFTKDGIGPQCQALYNVLHDCAKDSMFDGVHDYIHGTGRTTLIIDMVEKLQENGFTIIRGESQKG